MELKQQRVKEAKILAGQARQCQLELAAAQAKTMVEGKAAKGKARAEAAASLAKAQAEAKARQGEHERKGRSRDVKKLGPSSELAEDLEAAMGALEALECEDLKDVGATESAGPQAAKPAILQQWFKPGVGDKSRASIDPVAARSALEALEREDPKDDGDAIPRRKMVQWRPLPMVGPAGDVQKKLGPSFKQLAGDKMAATKDLEAALDATEAVEREDPKDDGATKLLVELRRRGENEELCLLIEKKLMMLSGRR